MRSGSGTSPIERLRVLQVQIVLLVRNLVQIHPISLLQPMELLTIAVRPPRTRERGRIMQREPEVKR
jgi:hypothetical protein